MLDDDAILESRSYMTRLETTMTLPGWIRFIRPGQPERLIAMPDPWLSKMKSLLKPYFSSW